MKDPRDLYDPEVRKKAIQERRQRAIYGGKAFGNFSNSNIPKALPEGVYSPEPTPTTSAPAPSNGGIVGMLTGLRHDPGYDPHPGIVKVPSNLTQRQASSIAPIPAKTEPQAASNTGTEAARLQYQDRTTPIRGSLEGPTTAQMESITKQQRHQVEAARNMVRPYLQSEVAAQMDASPLPTMAPPESPATKVDPRMASNVGVGLAVDPQTLPDRGLARELGNPPGRKVDYTAPVKGQPGLYRTDVAPDGQAEYGKAIYSDSAFGATRQGIDKMASSRLPRVENKQDWYDGEDVSGMSPQQFRQWRVARDADNAQTTNDLARLKQFQAVRDTEKRTDPMGEAVFGGTVDNRTYAAAQRQGLGVDARRVGGGVYIPKKQTMQDAMNDYTAGRVGSEGYGKIRKLMMDAKSDDRAVSMAATSMLENLGKGMGSSNAMSASDMIDVAKLNETVSNNAANRQLQEARLKRDLMKDEQEAAIAQENLGVSRQELGVKIAAEGRALDKWRSEGPEREAAALEQVDNIGYQNDAYARKLGRLENAPEGAFATMYQRLYRKFGSAGEAQRQFNHFISNGKTEDGKLLDGTNIEEAFEEFFGEEKEG